jgi:hypothetical protein
MVMGNDVETVPEVPSPQRKMRAREALKQGFRLARRTRQAVWVLLLANLGLAALAALPIYRGILRFTGHSLMSSRLAAGFSVDWLTDFSFNSPGSLGRYALWIGLLALLAIPMNSVLSGGVLARFRHPEQNYSLGDFFRNTCRYASRLLWLAVVGLVCYWLVFWALNQGLGGRVDRWTRYWLDDRPVFWAKLGVVALVLVGLGFVNLVMDFARVKLVMEDGTGVLQAFLASLGFSIGRFRRAFIVYALPALGGLALLAVYRLVVPWHAVNATGIAGSLEQYREPFVLALLFLGQQLVMFGRYWFRVATWASEWSLYAGTRPAAPLEEAS